MQTPYWQVWNPGIWLCENDLLYPVWERQTCLKLLKRIFTLTQLFEREILQYLCGIFFINLSLL